MMGRNRFRRAGAAATLTVLAVASSYFGSTAHAAAPGPYSGYAHATAVHVDAITSGDTRLANVDVATANAAVDSEGLTQTLNAHKRPIVDASKLGQKSYAASELVRVGVAAKPDAPNTLVNAPATATIVGAPGDDADAASVELLKQQVAPVANALVLHRDASAVWNADTCVLGEPISQGTFEAARVEAVDLGPDTATANFDKELVGIAANADGPERDAVNQVSLTQLYDGAGAGFGLMAATMSTIAPVTLFEGDPKEATVEILGPAVLRAMADGTAGGAKIEFSAPAVSIIQNGTRNIILPNSTLSKIQLPGPDGAVLDIRIGQLDVSNKASNGTSATAKGATVTVEVLKGSPAPAGSKGATIAIGHVEASVSVPAGGITCALRVDVDATPPSVGAGKTVEVTTTVYNDFDCPLQGVTLIDSLTTEQDATFTITEAAGAIRKTGGTQLTRGEIEWLIPSIAPHSSAQRSFTLRMDTGAGKVNITGDAAGKLANCKVSPGKDDATVAGLGSANANVGGVGSVKVPVSRVLGGGVTPGKDLPTTGVASSAAAGLFMLTSAGGLVTALRSRRIR